MGAERAPNQTLQVSYSGLGAEKVKTIPIGRRPGAKTRVAMTLPPDEVGRIGPGDSIWAGAEVEVSVTCLEPMPQCVGKIYHYSPYVRAQLVLASGPTATGPQTTSPISDWQRVRCSQELPNRNHHCVITVTGTRDVGAASGLPCQSCNVNLLLEAYHKKARRGNVVVVGSDDERRIEQDKGMINAGLFQPGPPLAIEPDVAKRPSRGRLAIGGPGGDGPKRVIYSRRVGELEAGEQLIIEAKMVEKIHHLPYNVLIQSQLVLSEKPGSTSRKGLPTIVASQQGLITAQNGFNCTQGKSGHRTPCVVRKVGVVKLFKDARTKPLLGEGPFVPLYVNLVVQNRAVFAGRSAGSFDANDAGKIARRAGFLRVRRYGPEFRR